MAKQHFYSRVPAKMSLFNRMDGYDTFAYSDGIEREQIETFIAEVYDNKPAKEDAALIQSGSLPTVYTQFTADDGTLIQSAMSFMQSDYTGERSAYMVHSLLLSEDEKKAHLASLTGAALDPDVFMKDLSAFDLTSFDAKPITDYPELAVPAKASSGTSAAAEKYDVGMMKRFIYTLYSIACGKVKSVYVGLPSKLDTLSSDALDLMNNILQVFPYHMRTQLPFVTYIGDQTKFSAFKVKFMSEKMPPVPTAKGVTLKMGMHDFFGVSDENIAQNAAVVDFFYSLLTDESVRKEFLDFSSGVVAAMPELVKPSVKNVTELVFMFRALSGYYQEREVLPNDDEMYSFVCTYDKYRAAMTNEYRARAMKPLKRYAEKQTAIPKNIFSKVTSMYPTETPVSKHTVMSVVLDLFHTDAMRDKLFSFIKANYASEDTQSRSTIMLDVCRVYYGGFLQDQIIDFFSKYFPTEPEDVRNEIIERLLLTIRTPKIQPSVIEFVDKYYDIFSDGEKGKIYSTFYEMLPDADGLTRALADIVDKHIEDERKDEVAAAIIKAVSTDERRKEPKLCETLAAKCGFTEAALASQVFTSWSGKKVFDTFVSAVNRKPLAERIDTLKEIWTSAPDMDGETADRLASSVTENLTKGPRFDLFEAIGAYDALDAMKTEIPASADFDNKLMNEAVSPAISALIPTVLDPKRSSDDIAKLAEIAKKNTAVKKSPAYVSVTSYINAAKAARSANGKAVYSALTSIDGSAVRKSAAASFAKATAGLKPDGDTPIYISAALSMLESGAVSVTDGANTVRDAAMAKLRADGQTDADAISFGADTEAVTAVMNVAADIYSTADDEVKAAMTAETSDVLRYVSSYAMKYDKKGRKTLLQVIDGLEADGALIDALKKKADTKPAGGGFFSKLFGKK